jgi:hypothetical protein
MTGCLRDPALRGDKAATRKLQVADDSSGRGVALSARGVAELHTVRDRVNENQRISYECHKLGEAERDEPQASVNP